MSTSGNTGPLGRPRGIGFGILMFIVTLHFYSWYWVFKTQEEIKQHTGEGLGGVLGLVIWILLGGEGLGSGGFRRSCLSETARS